jgi:hypothetical protein
MVTADGLQPKAKQRHLLGHAFSEAVGSGGKRRRALAPHRDVTGFHTDVSIRTGSEAAF